MEIKGRDIINRIDLILKQKNLKRLAAAQYANISLQSFTHWSVRGSIPAADTAIKIAEFLGVSVNWLITGKDPDGLSVEDRKLLDQWHEISDEGRKAVQKLLDSYARDAEDEKNKGMASS